MKLKRTVSLLLSMVTMLCLMTSKTSAAGTTPTFQCGGSQLTVEVEDADIVKTEQDGSNRSITIYLENVKKQFRQN